MGLKFGEVGIEHMKAGIVVTVTVVVVDVGTVEMVTF